MKEYQSMYFFINICLRTQFEGGNLCRSVSQMAPSVYIKIQFEQHFAVKFLTNLRLPTL